MLARTVRVLALVAAASLISACGRTGLELLSFPTADDAGAAKDAGMDRDAVDAADAPEDSPRELDVVEEPDGPDCGAPWVLFALAAPTMGGAGEMNAIYALRADGTEGHLVPLSNSAVAYPSVSPDGTHLLYANASRSALYLHTFGSAAPDVQLDTQGGVGLGSVSPDDRTVVFGDGQNLFLVGAGADAGPEETLVLEPQPNAAGSPVFTQDSRSVVFSTAGAIEFIDVDGGSRQTLLREVGVTFPSPTFSPDYGELAVILSCGGPLELRAYATASLPAACETGRLVAMLPASAKRVPAGPSWGPSGVIAYSDSQNVWLVKAVGGAPQNLTADLTHAPMTSAIDPTWAPSCTVLR
jgi:Tol biopolymer transport system component